MTRVNINGANHQVEVDHDGPLDYVIEHAQKLWEATRQPDADPGSASGYAAQVRLPTGFHRTGGYGGSGFSEVEVTSRSRP